MKKNSDMSVHLWMLAIGITLALAAVANEIAGERIVLFAVIFAGLMIGAEAAIMFFARLRKKQIKN